MPQRRSIPELLNHGHDAAIALAAIDRPDASFADLRAQVGRIGHALTSLGIGRGDSVAIVLPNGPEMASAFLGVASASVAAPLNPAYRAEELEFNLNDLDAKLVLTDTRLDSPVRAVATTLGIPVIDISTDPASPAGTFDVGGVPPAPAVVALPRARPDDVALVLHTSGTTARPKIVPLTHRNLCESAANIAHSLELRSADRCLNVMPLFHIHGLVAAVLASLAAGGSVCCTPGFNALRFFGWLKDADPTWYTAVPTMHQAILERAARHADTIAGARLRLVRSSSAPLPPQVMAALESTLGAPAVEAYGMTEAAHQMACNPLPPRARKPGSVGLAAGPDVAIMDAGGMLLPPDDVGEVVIRGANVMPGYRNNPDADAAAFTDGWFRTGDLGYLDAERYLRLTGRLKEMINRGGEKISPHEVDEVLLDHPDVREAVTFALPHPKLGEEVAAAVVLHSAGRDETSERRIRDFARTRLADFKVPRRIVTVDEIPKGPTGKIQRVGLAGKLGLTSTS